MNKIYQTSTLYILCLILASLIGFTACDNGDDVDTNQYTGGVKLNVFGPCPVARGGELRFLGSGMDQVTAIVLPGAGEVTDIKKISNTEIHITVPQNATEGLVTLKWAKGELTTRTPVTYSEPIALEAFTPLSAKAGAELTITGEYLNLIKEVIFADGVAVTQFVSQSRNEIKVLIPVEAQTGKIIISDGAEIPNWIYSDEPLAVTLPAITAIAPNPLKVGQALTITGTDFDLVEKVILPGGQEIVLEEPVAGTEIIIDPVADTTKEGPVVLVAKSGVAVNSEVLELVKPVITNVASANVRNGGELTITGTDLDLVSKVSFPVQSEDPANPQYVVVEAFTEQTATSLTLDLLATAVDGAFILGTPSETTTTGPSLTFAKPEVTALSATETKAGQDLTLTGTNLDLVATVMFGQVNATLASASATSLTVTVPVGAESGPLTLIMESNVTVVTTQTVTIRVALPVIATIEAEGPGRKITITGTQLNMIRTIYLANENGEYNIQVTDYGTKTDTKVEFYHVQGAATGPITPLMVTFDGDQGYMPVVYCGGADPIAPDAILLFDFETGSREGSLWDSFGALETAGSNHYYRGGGQIGDGDFKWLFADNQNGRPALADVTGKVLKFDMKADHDFAPGDYKIQWVMGDQWGWCTSGHFPVDANGICTTGGTWKTITLDFSTIGISSVGNGSFGLACQQATFDWSNICIDNVRIENK